MGGGRAETRDWDYYPTSGSVCTYRELMTVSLELCAALAEACVQDLPYKCQSFANGCLEHFIETKSDVLFGP